MKRSLTGKHVLVAGGTGSIGKGIVIALLQQGAYVYVLTRNGQKARVKLAELLKMYTQNNLLTIITGDVTDKSDLWEAQDLFRGSKEENISPSLESIIYSVGNCPPHGFDSAVDVRIMDGVQPELEQELALHVHGLANIVSKLLPAVVPGGHLVVISSAITRLTDEHCPPWLQAGHYATAKAAQDELVKWIRRDPFVKEKHILIHRLAPAAVNTPFHQGCRHSPPAMLTIEEVAHHVLRALQSDSVIDEMLLPPPPRLGQTKLL